MPAVQSCVAAAAAAAAAFAASAVAAADFRCLTPITSDGKNLFLLRLNFTIAPVTTHKRAYNVVYDVTTAVQTLITRTRVQQQRRVPTRPI